MMLTAVTNGSMGSMVNKVPPLWPLTRKMSLTFMGFLLW
jgi:hypothetical protein